MQKLINRLRCDCNCKCNR